MLHQRLISSNSSSIIEKGRKELDLTPFNRSRTSCSLITKEWFLLSTSSTKKVSMTKASQTTRQPENTWKETWMTTNTCLEQKNTSKILKKRPSKRTLLQINQLFMTRSQKDRIVSWMKWGTITWFILIKMEVKTTKLNAWLRYGTFQKLELSWSTRSKVSTTQWPIKILIWITCDWISVMTENTFAWAALMPRTKNQTSTSPRGDLMIWNH